MKTSIAKALFHSHPYTNYRKIVSDLLKEGKSSGKEQSEDLTHYSALNETRMNRLDKTIKIDTTVAEQLKALQNEYIWLVLAEGWCGDAAQIVPVINKMAVESDKIELRMVFRDENEELMQHFLTNGGRAIPKLIIIDKATSEVVSDWGPRPKGAAEFIINYKKEHGVVDQTAKSELQLWYLHDKGLSIQNEVLALIPECVEDLM
ncbi:thioredoxin family protein [Flavobacterium polysaccharolyticum]|uniref:Thioredoxin family protein n=1 Tax=Flavobacterium polysaccharolyticum TaxID=3133148 RepID=A0ABU9NLF9_9FLAO